MASTGGLLLTGGASSRMGRDKALLRLDGESLAERNGALLAGTVELALEVGPGRSGLAAVRETPPGSGPLAAIVAGRRALLDAGLEAGAPVLVLAVDLPLLEAGVLGRLVSWPSAGSVLPVVDGHAQPLCCRWSAVDLDAAAERLASGERGLRWLGEQAGVVLVGADALGVHSRVLADIDAPGDVPRLGLTGRLGGPPGANAPGQGV